jgi:hypothetical protein
MILLDKVEYDKVIDEMVAEGFFKRLEDKYRELNSSQGLASKTVSGSVCSSGKVSKNKIGGKEGL